MYQLQVATVSLVWLGIVYAAQISTVDGDIIHLGVQLCSPRPLTIFISGNITTNVGRYS